MRHPQPPAILAVEVVDEVGDEDADGDHELEADVEHAPHLRRRHLRQVQRYGLQHTSTGTHEYMAFIQINILIELLIDPIFPIPLSAKYRTAIDLILLTCTHGLNRYGCMSACT